MSNTSKRKSVKLALISIVNDEIIITRARDPYVHDVISVIKDAPVILACEIGFSWWISTVSCGFQSIFPIIATFIMPNVPFLVPAIPRAVEAFTPFELRINMKERSIYLTGRLWASFDSVASISVLTKTGTTLCRRFAVEICSKQGKKITVAETPVFEDLDIIHRFIADLRADRADFFKGQDPQNVYRWTQFVPGMRGYDKSDPFVQEIFVLQARLQTAIFGG